MNPWEMKWNDVTTNVQEAKAEAPKGLMPWQMKWNDASPTPQKQPVSNDQGLGNGLTLDSVFEGLKRVESGGKHIDEKTGKLVRSPVGAEGITQLMPKTASNPGYGIKPVQDKSEGEYLRVGKEYLQAMYKKYGDWEQALAAYNAGTGTVDKAKGKAERFGGDWKEHLPKPKETLPYISRILNAQTKDKPTSTFGVRG